MKNEPIVQIFLVDENGDILATKESLGFESAEESLFKLSEWYKNQQGELEAEQELKEEDCKMSPECKCEDCLKENVKMD